MFQPEMIIAIFLSRLIYSNDTVRYNTLEYMKEYRNILKQKNK
jgi:hypothetical protein